MFNRMQDGVVLNGRSDDVVTTKVADGGGNSGVVAFGSPTGKKNSGGPYTQDLRNGFPGILDGQPGFPSIRINGRRIAKMFCHIWQHGFKYFSVESRCSCIVKVDPLVDCILGRF
jgi:hypothetical protein